jgi:dinuclear metal center YbgI/SA1388 family protein
MPIILSLLNDLEQQIPLGLAESWDNVGLLWGDADAEATGVMTCLTLTEDVAREAIREGANLVITHHPILFKAVKRVTAATTEGRMLLELARQGICVYSPHSAFDSARAGINQRIALDLDITSPQPIRQQPSLAEGAGRWGELSTPQTLRSLLDRLKSICPGERFQFVGDLDRECRVVGVACGSAGEFLADAAALGCDLFVTGETRFHTCLEARTLGVAMVQVGHYSSERPSVEALATELAGKWPVPVWASRVESDPVKFYPA